LGGNSDGNTSNDGGSDGRGWQGDGVGPEGIASDPVLHDLIMGMGSSGETGGEKPAGAPGKKNYTLSSLSLFRQQKF
jgi:hypothetical protein